MLVQGKYRRGWSQKLLGRLPSQNREETTIWFHAVSVGEVLLLKSLIPELREQYGELNIVISTTTHTGQDVARTKYPDCTVCYCPLDFSWAVSRGLRRIQPDLLVLVELELWPNLIRAASQQQIPLAIINGRLSEKSFNGYRKIRPVISSLLQRFQMIAVQNETYASRFRKLGAGCEQVRVTGSVKYDQITTDRNHPETQALRDLFGFKDSETVLIAGSTQAPEEAFVLQTYKTLKPAFPHLRLIVVPRHQERFEEVASLIASHTLPFVRRSNLPRTPTEEVNSSKPDPIILLDTLGELGACWGLADLAYVGGSLTNRGGQNMIEPAAFGATVMFGPNTHHFRDAVFLLKTAEAATVIPEGRNMTSVIQHFLENPDVAHKMGERARQAVLPQQGATQRTVNSLLSLLPKQQKHAKNRGNALKRAA
ncbi:MAG: 3-deoxy-D-manno-octulosonic acid transferase [Planctomycetaceae bacterium]|nr:3-deoxy-D-manno-octulosonic acid transferase [Planctomycetaceae bacterium]